MAAASGASPIPPGAATQAAPVAAQAARSATPRKPLPLLWIGVAVLVVAGIAIGIVMTRGGSATVEPTPAPAATEAGTTPSPTPDPAQAAVVDPAAAAAGQAATMPTPAGTAARGTPTPTPGLARGATPGASPTPTGTPGARGATPTPVAPEADVATTFTNVKMYQVIGKRSEDRDAVLKFGDGRMSVEARSGGASLAAIAYPRITRGTYVKARDPKWDASLSSPPAGVEFGLGLFTRSAHWLVLQGPDHYEVLRLEDNNYARVIETIEARTGIKIVR
jgi:hypothetical protein